MSQNQQTPPRTKEEKQALINQLTEARQAMESAMIGMTGHCVDVPQEMLDELGKIQAELDELTRS